MNILWVWVILGILLGLFLMGTVVGDEMVSEEELDDGDLLDEEIFLFLLDEEEEELY
jgi:hypothetical protein